MQTLISFGLMLSLAAGACGGLADGDTSQNSPKAPVQDDQVQDLRVPPPPAGQSVAYLAGGCFWCLEASFERIQGVDSVVSGYSGGHTINPTYEESNTGQTGHAEAIAVYYDSDVVSYAQLLEVFFVAHDPTTLNRQGPDRGTQYRSGIFYETQAQLEAIEAAVKTTNTSGVYDGQVVTEIKPFEAFYRAEAYHQDYYELHPNQSYIYNVSRPKVEKVEKTFASILKPEYAKS